MNRKVVNMTNVSQQKTINLSLCLLDNFYRYLQVERDRSPKTIKDYQIVLKDFCCILNITSDNELLAITPMQISEWLEVLNKKQYSVNSKNTKIACLKSFYHFLEDYDYIQKSPMKRVKTYKERNYKEITFLNESQVKMFLSKCKNIRDRAIFTMLFTMGLRSSEIINIQINNLYLADAPYLIVRCKGNKELKKPIPNIVVPLISEYISAFRDKKFPNSKHGNLFLSNQGTPINPKSLNFTCKNIAKRANLGLDIHVHSCRHSFASNQLKKGASIKEVQENLGHQSMLTTANIYTHISLDDKTESINKYNFDL